MRCCAYFFFLILFNNMKQRTNESTLELKTILIIVVSIIIVLIIGGAILFQQKTTADNLQNSLLNQIYNLENQLSQSEKIVDNIKPDTNCPQEQQEESNKSQPQQTDYDKSICIIKKFIDNKTNLELSYYPGHVRIVTEYIPDYPAEKKENIHPFGNITQNDLHKEKEFIEQAKPESECVAFLGFYGQPDNIYCQIQEHGDSKGQLEIYGSRNDGEWVNVNYLFYKDDYRITIKARSHGNYSLQRWNSKSEFITTEEIINAYIYNKELTINLYNYEKSKFELVNFKKIFDEFKESIDSIKYLNNVD